MQWTKRQIIWSAPPEVASFPSNMDLGWLLTSRDAAACSFLFLICMPVPILSLAKPQKWLSQCRRLGDRPCLRRVVYFTCRRALGFFHYFLENAYIPDSTPPHSSLFTLLAFMKLMCITFLCEKLPQAVSWLYLTPSGYPYCVWLLPLPGAKATPVAISIMKTMLQERGQVFFP